MREAGGPGTEDVGSMDQLWGTRPTGAVMVAPPESRRNVHEDDPAATLEGGIVCGPPGPIVFFYPTRRRVNTTRAEAS